ncbi:hypothetical protein VU03_03255 [Desulfobulbus sp. N3]|nr:hypothetical protein [Desulfobulbus sp. N3]
MPAKNFGDRLSREHLVRAANYPAQRIGIYTMKGVFTVRGKKRGSVPGVSQ